HVEQPSKPSRFLCKNAQIARPLTQRLAEFIEFRNGVVGLPYQSRARYARIVPGDEACGVFVSDHDLHRNVHHGCCPVTSNCFAVPAPTRGAAPWLLIGVRTTT